MKKILLAIRGRVWTSLKIAELYFRKLQTGKFIKPTQDNTTNINSRDILLILVIKDEAHRLSYFLDYYRKLGINHFFIINNLSTDNIYDLVKSKSDVSVFESSQNYQDSKFGVDWVNYIAHKYCLKHWVLNVDADEYLVFPYIEHRNLTELTMHLDSTNQSKFFTILLDMYSKEGVSNVIYEPGDNPLDKCNYFDRIGYFQKQSYYLDCHIIGGPRLRVFNYKEPHRAPSLNKIPLLKWKAGIFYYLSTHVIIPKRYNVLDQKKKTIVTTGALLHFKFFNDIKTKASYAIKNKNHYNNSTEYEKYNQLLNYDSDDIDIYNKAISVEYKTSNTLLECQLMQVGEFTE